MNRKIGLIDADLLDNGTRHPNLALMKLSGFHSRAGAQVTLLDDYCDLELYDEVYVSKVFSFTKTPEDLHRYSNIKLGGTGFFPDGGEPLAFAIEHSMPDYRLYDNYIKRQVARGINEDRFHDYLNFSIGFTTRGCFRKCPFCVNRKYDRVQRHASVSEFLDSSRYGIYLWDDNFLGFDDWAQVLDELEETGKPFQFRQGLDIRLLDDHKARRLSRVRYHGDFIFAFDFLKDQPIIERNLRLWKSYYRKTTKLYVLCAYESQDENDIESAFKRIHVLMKYGCLPYIMRYDLYKQSQFRGMYIQLARWCNQPRLFKKMSFREFCEANQFYHKNKKTNCAAYQAMLDFESKFPSLAAEYFDLKYERENCHDK